METAANTLAKLKLAEGKHTSMITYLKRAGTQVSDHVSHLRNELGTARNIKSRTNRHSVQRALRSAMARVSTWKEVGPQGRALFVSAQSCI